MKHSRYFMWPLVSAALFYSCADNNQDSPVNSENIDGIYMTMRLTQQPASRSVYGDEGIEQGQDFENEIETALVVMARAEDNTVISSASFSVAGSGAGAWLAQGKFDRDKVLGYLDGGDKTVHLFVVCNPGDVTFTEGEDIQKVMTSSTMEDAARFGDISHKFMMTNADPADYKITLKYDDVRNGSHTSDKDPLMIGPLKVQRNVARFDLATGERTFYFPENSTAEDAEVTVTLDAVALLNMSRDFHLFKQIGSQSASWEFFGTENGSELKIVRDPRNSEKESLSYTFFNPVSSPLDDSDFVLFDNIKEDYEHLVSGGTVESDMKDKSYYSWRYCLPNTVHDPLKQVAGNTTGIVFRGILTVKEGSVPSMDGEKAVYAFNNKIYGDLDALEQAMQSEGVDFAVKTAFNTAKNSVVDEDEDKSLLKEALVKKGGFTLFTPRDGKYYVYYYYWNRHIDNGKEGEIGPMEFAVVRNNVYKLAVTRISRLGHPSTSGDDPGDPNPITPESPIETKDFYIAVSCTVLDWTARVNDIEF